MRRVARCGLSPFKRPSFARQEVAFCNVKGHLLPGLARPPGTAALRGCVEGWRERPRQVSPRAGAFPAGPGLLRSASPRVGWCTDAWKSTLFIYWRQFGVGLACLKYLKTAVVGADPCVCPGNCRRGKIKGWHTGLANALRRFAPRLRNVGVTIARQCFDVCSQTKAKSDKM